jgi:quinoprotein glucose dehydrogenase
MTIDAERAIAYIPLGSPTYDFYGADRIGANLFGTSVVALDARTGERRWHYQLVHHDLWDLDPSAAPQLTTIEHEGRRRDVVAVGGKSGWLYVFDRDSGVPIWPIEERPVPQSQMPLEESWPTQPSPTAPPPFSKHAFSVEDLSPYLREDEAEAFRERLLAANNLGVFTPISLENTVHIPTSNGGVLFGGMAGEPESGAVYVVAHDNPGILRLVDPDENSGRRGGGPPVQPGQIAYQEHCQVCHGADRRGTDTGVALLHAEADPEKNIAAGAPVFSAAQIRVILATGNGRMPAFPHLDEGAVNDLVAWLTAPAGGRGFGGFGRRGGGPAGSGAPPELVVGSGSQAQRPARGRGAGPAYPQGSPDWKQYTINEYNTVGNRIAPPYTSIVKYDLNTASIAWSVGFGDDPALAARGITGTGVAGLLNGVIVTESGLVFAAGGDNRIRAYDSATGERLWSAPFGGNFVGSPVMYRMDGRQYLLVPAAGSQPRGGSAATDAPLGWVAYALPDQAN